MERILIVGVNWLGDSLFTLPFVRALRDNFKNSYIAIMLLPRIKELYEGNPYLDDVIVYDEKGRDKFIFGKFRIIKLLKEKKFDTAFILRPSFSRTLICYLAKIKERIGFSNPRSNFLLTKKINPLPANTHRIDQNLKILEGLGLLVKDRAYHLETHTKDDIFIKDLLLQNGIKDSDSFILINAGGNWLNKRWNYKNFAKLADRIINELHLKVVISGAVSDTDLVSQIKGLMKNDIVSTCGRTNILQLASLMKKALLVVSSDSGPMHLAAAVGTKVIALFGPTSPLITGPYPLEKHIIFQLDVGCKTPCYIKGCTNIRCMDAITIDEVFRSVKQSLNK